MLPLAALIRRTTSLFLCLLMLVPATLFDAAAFAQQQTGTTFTSEANLVLVPVTVTDHAGNHIAGLTQADFTVLDDGKPVKITSFEEVKEIPPTITKPKEPGMYTNAVAQPQSAKGMTIIVLDQINTPFLDQSYARQQLLKFLADHISTNEPTALITIGTRGVRVVHDFTTDTSVLVEALKKVSGRVDTKTLSTDTTTALAATGNVAAASLNSDPQLKFETSELDAFYNGTDTGYGSFAITEAIEITLNALRHIAEGMEGIPGRKSMIWATGGFPFTFESNGELASLRYYTTGATHAAIGGLAGGVGAGGGLPPLPESSSSTGDEVFAAVKPYWERTMQAMNKANIAIYPIDARGLVAYSSAASNRVRLTDVYGTEAQTHGTMNDIADITGGKAYYNTNDISGAFNKATKESTQYYMVGYYAEKSGGKNLWHKLQVKVDKPDLQVRTRTGYMSGPVQAKKQEDIKNSDIRSALASPLDYTALQMRVYVDPAQPGSGNKKKVPFEIDVNPGSATVDTANKNHVSLDMLAVAHKPTGEDAARVGYKLEANVPDAQVQQVVQQGLNYKGVIEIAPGTYTVRFVVRDNVSGRLGSVTAPVTVQ